MSLDHWFNKQCLFIEASLHLSQTQSHILFSFNSSCLTHNFSLQTDRLWSGELNVKSCSLIIDHTVFGCIYKTLAPLTYIDLAYREKFALWMWNWIKKLTLGTVGFIDNLIIFSSYSNDVSALVNNVKICCQLLFIDVNAAR